VLRGRGETQQRIAEPLGMSISTVKRYLERHKQTGSVAARVQGRMKPRLGATELNVIETQLETAPLGFSISINRSSCLFVAL
jgi:transposase